MSVARLFRTESDTHLAAWADREWSEVWAGLLTSKTRACYAYDAPSRHFRALGGYNSRLEPASAGSAFRGSRGVRRRSVVEEYRQKVKRLALERTGEAFYNASEDHAAIIVENMFRTATREVCILSRHLAPRIYGRDEGVSWATIFLADNEEHSMRILLREGDLSILSSNPLYQSIKNSKNVFVRAIEDGFFDELPYRFLVTDGDSYRFEPDHSKCSAIAAFGSGQEGPKLQRVFEVLWNASRPVNLDNLDVLHPMLA